MSSPSASGENRSAAASLGWGSAVLAGVEASLCFILPLSTLAFLLTGPHAWQAALLWTSPVWLCVMADYFSPADRRLPAPDDGLERFLDARLYVLFALQLANVFLALDAASRLRWGTPAELVGGAATLAALRVLMGTTSCCSGLAVAHELIHRRARHLRWMGRILLWTVCYDHFAVEHGRGHHRLAATLADPATARHGESFDDFFRRSLRGQWLDAWRLESRRLHGFSALGQLRHHRVLHGLGVEFALLAWIMVGFGPLALGLFLYQAWVAVRMLEAVNYVQHFGLLRCGPAFGGADAWSTDAWFSLHAFIGLCRHADHHLHAGKPCQHLRHREESPRLPHGYFVMVLMVRLSNRCYLAHADRELRARGLGPFRPMDSLVD